MIMDAWQFHCSELKQRTTHLLRTKLWTDVSFQFIDENQEDKKLIKAHKLILAMASPVFARLLYNQDHIYEDPIPVCKIPANTFEVLLEYMYSDNLNIDSINIASTTYRAAKRLKMPYVAQKCTRYLLDKLTDSNVCQIYEMTTTDDVLRRACEKVFQLKTQEVLNHSSFLQAQQKTVLKIFSLPSLNIESELDLLSAAVKYVDAQDLASEGLDRIDKVDRCDATVSQEQNDPKEDTEGPPAKRIRCNEDTSILDLRKTPPKNSTEDNLPVKIRKLRSNEEKAKYRPILQQIRFLTVSPLEFSEYALMSELLTEAEVMAICMNICSKDTYTPMPEGFSTSLVPRSLSNVYERSKPSGSFVFSVFNIRNLKKYESPSFFVRNMAWTLLLGPSRQESDVMVIGVTCHFESQVPSWVVDVKIKLKFYSQKSFHMKLNKMCSRRRRRIGYSTPSHRIWLTQVKKSDLLNPDCGFIAGDVLTCKVYITTEAKTEADKNNRENIKKKARFHKPNDEPNSTFNESQCKTNANTLGKFTALYDHSYVFPKKSKETMVTNSNTDSFDDENEVSKENKTNSPILENKPSSDLDDETSSLITEGNSRSLEKTDEILQKGSIETFGKDLTADCDLFSDDDIDGSVKDDYGTDEASTDKSNHDLSNFRTCCEDPKTDICDLNTSNDKGDELENGKLCKNDSISKYYNEKIDDYIKQNLLNETDFQKMFDVIEAVNLSASMEPIIAKKNPFSTNNPLSLKTITLSEIMKNFNVN